MEVDRSVNLSTFKRGNTAFSVTRDIHGSEGVIVIGNRDILHSLREKSIASAYGGFGPLREG